MLKNYNHDLIHQLSEISDSIWRMKQYKENSKDCKRCFALWADLERRFDEIAAFLEEELKRHIKENKFE